MGSLAAILNVTVEHGFYADGLAQGLAFRPDAGTTRRLQAPWWAMRTNDHQLLVVGDLDAAAAADDLAPLRFLAWVGDPALWTVSEPFVAVPDKLLRFASERAVRDDDGRWRLHKGTTVARDDLRSPHADAQPHPLVPARRPLFELVVTPDAQAGPRDAVIRFAARRAFWTYHLQGRNGFGPLRVVDADGALDFKDLGSTRLATTGEARSFRSARPLALGERPAHRFQVRERRGDAERVVVRRLPGPSARLSRVPDRRDRAVQAEIFVNL